mgnify:CR=1 FL=1
MTDQRNGDSQAAAVEVSQPEPLNGYGEATWGPWLFRGVFVASLVFAWWLVIYDHGVVSSH